MNFEFNNKHSEYLLKKLLEKNKTGEFKKHFDEISNKKYFYNTNAIPENTTISLSAFQAIEF